MPEGTVGGAAGCPFRQDLHPKDCPQATCWAQPQRQRLMAMIQAGDESLRALVKRDALDGSKADVAFDAPTKEWSSRRNTPTVDLYLYDIREDLERREVMWEDSRGDARDPRVVTERRPPPRRFKLSYLVTAWTQRPEDENRLLSAVLSCFMPYPALPENALSCSLAQAGHH